MTSGSLLIRDAGESYAMERPTLITGTNTDGVLSNVALSTPAITFVYDVAQYNTTATISASFSMVEPGAGTINDQGNITLRVRVAVDLHIVVGILPDPRQCRAAPIDLTLSSPTPYDPTTRQVALTAPNFSIPEVVAGGACNAVVEALNEALAGPGHSLSLTVEGDITPPVLGEPTATSLVVTPAGGSRLGQEVAMAATVTPDPEVPGAPAPSGIVTFFDGEVPVGTAEVGEDGTAAATTTGLGAGPRELRAEYSGAPPDWKPSSSVVIPHVVTTDPFVSADLAGTVRVGGPGRDFAVTVTNTGFGVPAEGARLEVTIGRSAGNGPIGPNGATPRIVLSRVADGTATPVALTSSGSGANQRLAGTIGDATTWAVPPGSERTEGLRLEVAAGTAVGPLALTFTLATGEGDDRVVLGSTVVAATMVLATRQATTVAAGAAANPGIPPFLLPTPARPPVTPVVRQGSVAQLVQLRVEPALSGVRTTGTVAFSLDGVPVPGQILTGSDPQGYRWLPTVPAFNQFVSSYFVKIPADTPTGTRSLTIRHSGDDLFAPSQVTYPLEVLPAVGAVYACAEQGLTRSVFTANVEIVAGVPSVWPTGRDVPLDRVDVRIRLSRTTAHEGIAYYMTNPDAVKTLRFDLGPDGEVVPGQVVQTNATAMGVDDTLDPDHLIELTAGTGSLPVTHAPGTTEDVTLDGITLTGTYAGFGGGFICTPEADPQVVGSVTAAGVTLAADPGEVVPRGGPVTLTATALPATAGAVEFRDGTATIGVVPVDGSGTARLTTRALPVGPRALTARFFGGSVPMPPSEPVGLRVATCQVSSVEGSGAVVRLVYLELLGRCPDAAGFAHWTSRLDAGTTPEAFTRSIAGTPEAVGRVVDDAYVTMLGRRADAEGRAFWTRRLSASGRYDQLLADLGASEEFWNRSGRTNTGFVTRVYDRLLGRAPDGPGLDHWTGRLAAGESRRALITTLANLDEPLGRLVAASYGEILDRAPDGTERGEGIAFLRRTGDRSGLYAQLIGAPEFATRAQGLPD